MFTAICVFEDEFVNNLLPLTYLRPVYDLKCGLKSLHDKIVENYPDTPIIYHSRKYIRELTNEMYDSNINDLDDFENCLFINGRFLSNEKSKLPKNPELNKVYVNNGNIVAAFLDHQNFERFVFKFADVFSDQIFSDLEQIQIDVEMINYPWDLFNKNGQEIINDFQQVISKKKNLINSEIAENVYLKNKKRIYIGENCDISPFVYLDASAGPIYIGNNVTIMSHTTIQGPAAVLDNSTIKIGSKIYHDTTIGEVCKVGGEIENSIFHSYANKQHDGFIGHSYLGSWVNLGAGTNNSDLKNNYSTIRVNINGKEIDSGLQFVGLTIGDHSKTAIGTQLNTGTVIGVSSNIFGSGFPPKYIPPFSWGGSDGITDYDFEKSLEVAKRVMSRRNVELTDNYKKTFRKVFKLSK
ncbi:MAG: hypothetical protein K9J16_02520 [Melioribacteraceae bacterium]|nr:hypothetical protein [Melioribacteraceae bacterium]MCF8352882.1 hypothetical protein [Melioribacteraceae bacterium]MCF8393801.1 hypothetical protein [Melioribacteraceae bacterium]MCF8417399.1 hypothetical protein [Melioribacteraceae bacterium]